MKKTKIIFFIITLIVLNNYLCAESKIELKESFLSNYVYINKGPNRLGDTLIRYCKHKWLAFLFNFPLFYDPFEYSEELMLSEMDYSTDKYNLPNNGKWISKPDPLDYNKYKEMLDVFYESKNGAYLTYEMIKEMKKEKDFICLIRRAISPKKELNLIYPPQHLISVAVHIRKGTGFDGPLQSKQIIDPKYSFLDLRKNYYLAKGQGFDVGHPLKAPPEQFYIDQIKKIAEIFNFQPLYVYIFTDDPSPLLLMSRIKQAVNIPNIFFDCRGDVNRQDKNVLIDLFSMCNFDCLIRSYHSAYTQIVHLIGEHSIVIYPTSYTWINGYLKMEDIKIEINDDNFKNLNRL